MSNILPINVYGDKILRKKAIPVKEMNTDTLFLIKEMFETMRYASGIGLAANQVGSKQSIFVVDISEVKGYEKVPPTVFINPKITKRSDELIIMEEGCLSIPRLHADVERPEFIKINYLDADMNEKELEADGVLARVIQHEYDHLKGVLFTDKIEDAEKKRLKEELLRIKDRKIKIDYPITIKN